MSRTSRVGRLGACHLSVLNSSDSLGAKLVVVFWFFGVCNVAE